jgi:hypothetical protein
MEVKGVIPTTVMSAFEGVELFRVIHKLLYFLGHF